MSQVFLNGEMLPLEQARIPVLDRGFLFGDGVYEVIPVFAGRLFRIDEHLRRLQNSLDAVRIPNPMTAAEWRVMLTELCAQYPGQDQSLYLQVTRGVDHKRDHLIPQPPLRPTLFAMTSVLELPASPPPVRLVTRTDQRWLRCDIKAITLLANLLSKSEAAEADADEALLVRDGWVNEGAASNLFIVRDGVLLTPPAGPQLLPGITRDLLLELAARHRIPAREQRIDLQQLHSAEEIWITSSTREIRPAIELDGQAVGDGQPGPIWWRMFELYRQFKQEFVSHSP
jgi:D-alanine transaminase